MLSGGTLTPALIGVSLTAALVATPYGFTYTGPSKGLLLRMAAAQSDSDGSASDGSDTGSSSESQSSGESGTESGGIGTAGPSETGQDDGALSSDVPADSGGAVQEDSDTVDGATEPDSTTEPVDSGNTGQAQQEPTDGEIAAVPTEEAVVEVRYSNGMREEIRDGRYEMTDVQGRVIINRPATESDYARLLRAIGK